MRLTLHYRGALKANGGPTHKHELRRQFHVQLKKLWSQRPLSECPQWLRTPRTDEYCVIRPMGAYRFAALVTEEMNLFAEVQITLLRPEPPGALITHGGDIDNRLKTLFDALTMPRQPNALPAGAVPISDEEPFHCLLEDDNLITAVSVRTEQLLEPADPSLVDLTIQVHVYPWRHTMDNSAFL